jgi:hypothetical protein
MSQTDLYKPCLKRDGPGIEKATEVLPDKGTLK